MSIHGYDYTEEFDIEKLNSFFIKNSEKQKIVYEKLKKINESSRQIFISKMIEKIIAKSMNESVVQKVNTIQTKNVFLKQETQKISIQKEQYLYNTDILANEIKMKESVIDFSISGSFVI